MVTVTMPVIDLKANVNYDTQSVSMLSGHMEMVRKSRTEIVITCSFDANDPNAQRALQDLMGSRLQVELSKAPVQKADFFEGEMPSYVPAALPKINSDVPEASKNKETW